VDDCGGAFAMGAIGGGVFHSIKGFRNAPSVSLLHFFNVFSSMENVLKYFVT